MGGLMKLQWDSCLYLISKDEFYKVTISFERGIASGLTFYNNVGNLEHAQ